jgi:thiosulfate dehydrogenase [quinone] large subunit
MAVETSNKLSEYLIGLTRIAMGILFLWPFLDKTFGLGYTTTPENSFLAGASPTRGFLNFATNEAGPFAFFFKDVLGGMYQIVDLVFMAMLLVVGVGLILGILTRVGGISGAIFMFAVILAEWPILQAGTHNPVIEEHWIYMFILLFLAAIPSGNYLGLGKRWSELSFVEKVPILK